MSDISTAPTLIPSSPQNTNQTPTLTSKELQTLHDLQALHSIQSELLHDAPAPFEEDPDLSRTAVNIDTLLRQAQSMITTLVAEKRGKSRRIRVLEEELHAAREKGRALAAEAKAKVQAQAQVEVETRGELEAKVKASAEEVVAARTVATEREERVKKLEGEVKGIGEKLKKVEGERDEKVKGVKEQMERNKGLERDVKAKGALVQDLTARLNRKKGEGKEQAAKLAKVMAANEELKGALSTARKRAESAAQRAQEAEEQVKLERKRRRKAEKELKGEEDVGHGHSHGHGHGHGHRREVYSSVPRSKSSVISRMFRGV
ncbi:hypothetical protein P170DRAFT_424534 [Aspergillus steynii IBT 23096]|uniref:Uncharacterized protein n=1 Tax=Aspergillus steynii IBT 23096 TaxID=1392250 RepID=A0A2I2GB48_9EURO|nr:uncharacterized protein P170DRAFT_424534 [Aspergillus steynii IBT 23096]PLB50113.1 hypothetical protein P170DRAFT_424534 [Aspergillus steynii IBT 23096]